MSGHGSYGAFCDGEFTVTESPSFVCAWDDDATVEIHTIESLHAKYDRTNLFDPAPWKRGYKPFTPKWESQSADLEVILSHMQVGDEWSSGNCSIRRIK